MESSHIKWWMISISMVIILIILPQPSISRDIGGHGNIAGELDVHTSRGSLTSQGHGQETSRVPTMVKLPQLMPMIIEYAFVKLWNMQDPFNTQQTPPGYCTPIQMRTIRDTCKIGPLSAAIAGQSRGQKNPRRQAYKDFAEFQSDLDKICSVYNNFERCIRGLGVDKCRSDDKTVVNDLYSYLCGAGRQALLDDNSGLCLSKIHRTDVMNYLKVERECETSFGDMSSTMQTMLSVYHMHGLNNTDIDETPAIRQHLFSLCQNWYTMEKCIFPAYARMCGDSAEKFYVGLLDTMKQSLVGEFSPLGQDIAELAKCNKKTGAKIKATPLTKVNNDAFMQYIRQQEKQYRTIELTSLMRYGPCSPITVSSTLTSCFWHTCETQGPSLVNIFTNIATHQQAVSRYMTKFSECVEGSSSGCKPQDKLDFTSLARHAAAMASHAVENIRCMDALSVARISQERCGITMPDILNYYTFQGAMIYNNAQSSCDVNIPFQSFPDLSCLTETVSSMATNSSMYGQHVDGKCVQVVLLDVKAFMASLDDIMKQTARFFKNVFETLCQQETQSY